jgi:hypothetical protein
MKPSPSSRSPQPGRLPTAALLACLLGGQALTAQSVVTSLENYFPGQAISVSFNGGPGNSKDWIGVYPEGVTPGSTGSTIWNYVNGTRTAGAGLREGSMTFGSGLNLAGVWTAYLLVNDGYTVVTNVSFNVLAPTAPAVRPSDTRYAPGQTINVGFTNGPANPKDWIGVYPEGVTPGSTGSTIWNYVDGTQAGNAGKASGLVTFQKGLTAVGKYRAYLLENDGYTILASEPITVAVPIVSGASVVSTSPAPDTTGVAPNAPYRAELTNGIALASIRLSLNGKAAAATVTGTAQQASVTFTNALLLAPASSNVYVLSFSDTSVPAQTFNVTNAFQVANYRNIELPAPLVFENFDAIPEGQVPTGWTRKSYVEIANPELDFGNLGSAAYADWTSVDASRFNGSFVTYNNPENPADWGTDYQRVNVINPANVVNGQILNEPLAKGRFLFSTSGYSIGRSQVMHITTPDYNLSGRTNVQVAFKSLWEQNQDSIGAVEYSINGGAQWLPLVYLIDEADLVKAEDGSLDAEATLNKEHGDVANYTDDAGTVIGGTYGAFIGAPITASLAPFIQGRVNDNRFESKRYELFRVSGADNQSKVRFRFIQAGTDSWYWGIDDFGLYAGAASSTNTPSEPAKPFALLDINNTVVSTVVTNADGSFTLTAGGGDTWDNADSFSYLHQQRSGDFDVRVQVLSVEADDAASTQKNAKGALHIRANLTPGSPNIQLNASPIAGANYVETIFRPVQDGGTDDPANGSIKVDAGPSEGTYRPNAGDLFPVWLRARRERNLFRTFVSTDGIQWKVLAEYQMDNFPTNVHVGLGAVAHISTKDNEDPANRVRASFKSFGNTPLPPAATVSGAPAGTNSPGTYPDRTVTAVNWHISLPTDGIGYTADKTQSGPIVWNTGGFGTISRDLLLSINGEQGPMSFGIARYAAGALDFGIGVRDATAAQENLGPYSNPTRQRYGAPEASVPSAQSWFPSPKHGVLVTSTRKVGSLQWNDGAAPFYAHAFMAVDGSSTRHFNMDDGSFGGGDFYLRMAKLADTAAHPNAQANSAGGFQRAAFDNSVAWFPYSQGWKAGYFADASGGAKGRWSRAFSHSAAAGEGSFVIDRQISAALLRWEDLGGETFGGLATLTLPEVNSKNDGLLFLTGNDDGTARGPQVNCLPTADGKGWTVAVRSVEENKQDPATYAATDKCEFSFVYVPLSAGNLIGGEIAGSSGATTRKAGQFTSTRLAAGKYRLQIPGKSGKDGMLILQSVGQHPSNASLVDNTTLAYEATADGFVVEARALNPAADATPGSVSLRDANFYFAWVDFVTPLTPAAVVPTTAPVLSVQAAGAQYVISWPSSVTGYVLESATSLTQSVWSNVTGVSGNSVSIPADSASRFFRLRKP